MNVWIVNPFDNLPSEGNRPQRYWLMAEAFVRAGHRVVYWTSDFSHAHKAKRRSRNEVKVDSGIEVIQIPTLPYAKNICWARVKSHRQLAKDFERLATQRINSLSTSPHLHVQNTPDLVIASTPPLGLCNAAMRVARMCGAKFVCDVQDAWPETFERVLPSFVWSLMGMRKSADRLYRGADGVSAVSRRYIELAKARGCATPTHLAGHAIGVNFNTEAQRHRDKESELRLVYAGNMSLSYDLETVIKTVQDMPSVTLDIAGNGPDRDRLQSLSTCSPRPNNIRFHGYLGEQELAGLLRSCDVGLIPMFPESCVGVPGKLADYAAAGLRVIESLGGECQEIVEKHHAGVHYTAGEMTSLKDAISKLGSSAPLCLDAEMQSCKEAFARYFDAQAIMGDYVKWCVEIVA